MVLLQKINTAKFKYTLFSPLLKIKHSNELIWSATISARPHQATVVNWALRIEVARVVSRFRVCIMCRRFIESLDSSSYKLLPPLVTITSSRSQKSVVKFNKFIIKKRENFMIHDRFLFNFVMDIWPVKLLFQFWI